MVTEPLEPPWQATSGSELNVGSAGIVSTTTVTEAVAVQPLASVIVTT